MTDFVVLKLSDGSDIVGKLYEEKSGGIVVQDALELKLSYDEYDDKNTLHFIKYSMYTKEFDVFFPNSKISFISKAPLDSLVKYYNISLKDIKKYWVKHMEKGLSTINKSFEKAYNKKSTELDEKTLTDFYENNMDKKIH
jgi:hypothetical protein